MSPDAIEKALETWTALNKVLRTCDEATAQQLLVAEKDPLIGKRRATFIKRIHSRINRLRAARERKELLND